MRFRSRLLTCVLMVCLTGFWRQPAEAQAAEGQVRLTFEDLGVVDSLSLMGMYGTAYLWVPFQSNWVVEEPVAVAVTYVASPLLSEERTTLTVLANNEQVSSIYPTADGAEHTFSFDIPVELLVQRGVLLTFKGHLTLPPLECPETHNPAQWMTILDRSSVTITPSLDTTPPTLGDLPQAIMVQNAPENPPPVVFVLPNDPDQITLTTAAQVAARLGSGMGGELFPIEVQTAGALTTRARADANLVVIGLPDNQPLIDEMGDALPAPLRGENFIGAGGVTIAPDNAVIQIFNAPWDATQKVLLVSAGSVDGLQIAGLAFADSATFQSFQSSFEVVRGLVEWPEPISGRPWTTETTSFADLGFQDRSVSGSGLFDEYFSFYLPPGWALEDNTQLTLHIASSPALHSGVSHIAAYINEVPVGVVRTGEDFEEAELTFNIPVADLAQSTLGAHPQMISVRLSVANFMHEISCEESHPDAAWVMIHANSSIMTPHTYLPLPNLEAFPYPFVSDTVDAPVTIVVPPRPTSRELGMALSLAASLGRFAPIDFTLNVLTADQVSPEAQSDANLIILGTQTRQPLIDEMFASMPPIPGEALEGLLLVPDTGWLREDASPWNPDRIALLVYATSAAGLENAVDALFNAAPPITQPGSVAIVGTEQSPRVVFCATCEPTESGREQDTEESPAPGEQQPAGGEELVERPPSLAQILGVVTVIFGIAAAAVLGTLWLRRRQRAGQADLAQEEEPKATNEG